MHRLSVTGRHDWNGTGLGLLSRVLSCGERPLTQPTGMVVSLSLHLPGTARIKLKQGLVTWARKTEFGLRFLHGPATMHQERSAR